MAIKSKLQENIVATGHILGLAHRGALNALTEVVQGRTDYEASCKAVVYMEHLEAVIGSLNYQWKSLRACLDLPDEDLYERFHRPKEKVD